MVGSWVKYLIIGFAKGRVNKNYFYPHFVDKRLSKISVTFKTQDGDNSESFKKLKLNKIIVPCDIYRSQN